MTRIFIEDQELDINAELTNAITYAIDDLRNIDSKSTAFSKTIVLPGTAKNNEILGNIFDLNQSNYTIDSEANVGYNFNAAKSARAFITFNNIQVMKGVIRLLKIINDRGIYEYEMSIFGELGGLVMKLGTKKIEELDFSAYNHTYNTTNIVNSWDNYNAGSGYYYPLIDYGNYSTNKKDWKVKTFRPAIFAKQVIDKIFDGIGYTYECDLFNTDRFKKIIIPHSFKDLRYLSSDIVDASGVDSSVSNITLTEGLNVKHKFTSFTSSAFVSLFDNQIKYVDTPTISLNLSLKIDGTYKMDDALGALLENDLWIAVRKNGVIINGTLSILPFELTYSALNYEINNIVISVSTNDILDVVYLEPALVGACSINILPTSFNITLKTQVPIPVPIQLNDTVLMNDTLPKGILQKDFFISIIKLFNLYVEDDKWTEKHLIIKPYPDYYVNGVEDWSDKIDRSKPIQITPMSELNSRYYSFKYKADNDYYNELYRKRYNEGYGDRIYDSTFEFSNETQSVEVIFSSTPLVGYANEVKVYPTIFKKTGNPPNEVEENIDSNIRIMLAKKLTGLPTWKILNDNGTNLLTGLTTYGAAGHYDDTDAVSSDLNFGATKELFFTLLSGDITANQFNVYYSPYMAEITDKDSRLITASFRLNEVDILNLDFSKYKYIDGGYYRLMKVIDYVPEVDDTVQCELLKVIYTTY